MKKTITIIILSVLALGLAGYICYDKLYAKEETKGKEIAQEKAKEKKEEKSEIKTTTKEETTTKSESNSSASSNSTNNSTSKSNSTTSEKLAPWLDYLLYTAGVKITKIEAYVFDDNGTITVDELKNIVSGSEVNKTINPCGRGGINEGFTITYEKNGVEYKAKAWGATSNTSDADFINAVNKSVTKTYNMTGQGCDDSGKETIDILFDYNKLQKYLTD